MPGPMEFSTTATGGSPVEQLREALNGIFAQLRGAGGRAADFTVMTWRAAEPGAFDPSRSEIDLCYREVFGGFRPGFRSKAATARSPCVPRPTSCRETIRGCCGGSTISPSLSGR